MVGKSNGNSNNYRGSRRFHTDFHTYKHAGYFLYIVLFSRKEIDGRAVISYL
jgi:hypothetical protein